jgi:hypothetical protein
LTGSAGGHDTLTVFGTNETILAENTGDTLVVQGPPSPISFLPSANILQSSFAGTTFDDGGNNTIIKSGGAANDTFNLNEGSGFETGSVSFSATGKANVFNFGDGSQTVTANGANDVFNVSGNGTADVIASAKGATGDVDNVGLGGGETTLALNSTAQLNFADNWQNVDMTKNAAGGWDITFADTGAFVHVTGVAGLCLMGASTFLRKSRPAMSARR